MMQELAINMLKIGLEAAQKTASGTDFNAAADDALNKAEGYFKEGSFADIATETVTGAVRDSFGIADSNPGN